MRAFYDDLAEVLELNPSLVTSDLDLTQLDWDSLAFISTISLVDRHFGVMLNGDDLEGCRTVGDIEKLITEKKSRV